MPDLKKVTLYKKEGTSDKVYGLRIINSQTPGLFDLYYSNGPRGGTMTNKLKAGPLSLELVQKEFEKVQKAKMKDGYTTGEDGKVYTNSPDAGRVCGYRPMLPSDLPKADPAKRLKQLLTSDEYGMQLKADGENRILIIKDGVIGANKNGLFTDVPEEWSRRFQAIGNVVLLGEHCINDEYFAFDIIEHNGKSLKSQTFARRYALLEELLTARRIPGMNLIQLVTGTKNKQDHLKVIAQANGEGVVLKRLDATFEEGKSTDSIRYKLYETMTCFVTSINTQRSVGIGAHDPATGRIVDLGNVTIPINQPVPALNTLQEVRYLYRFQNGALEQPTYLRERTDVLPETVTTDQITRVKVRGANIDLNNDDETLTDRSRQEIALDEFTANLASLASFMTSDQLQTIKSLAHGTEQAYQHERIKTLVDRIQSLPCAAAPPGNAGAAIAQLRYFNGMGEWLITAIDANSKGLKVYGAVDAGGGVDIDAFSIAELLEINAEIDLDFEPTSINAHFEEPTTMAAQPVLG